MIPMRLSPSLRQSLSAAWLAFFSLGVLAQTEAPEPDLKAAIITNMLMFVEWPARSAFPANQLRICLQGDGPVASALSQLDGKTFRNKVLKVFFANAGNVSECQALYISPAGVATLDKTMGMVGSSPVLIASDSPEFFQRGTMLNLERVSGRIVFDVDLRSTQKAGLQISSKALRMARQVAE